MRYDRVYGYGEYGVYVLVTYINIHGRNLITRLDNCAACHYLWFTLVEDIMGIYSLALGMFNERFGKFKEFLDHGMPTNLLCAMPRGRNASDF